MSDYFARETRLGFCGPEDQVISLSVPLAAEDRQNSSFHSFDIEYDSEQPNMLTIRLFELDQHGFVRTSLQSASFPAVLLGDLATRRKATAEEVAEWTSGTDDD